MSQPITSLDMRTDTVATVAGQLAKPVNFLMQFPNCHDDNRKRFSTFYNHS